MNPSTKMTSQTHERSPISAQMVAGASSSYSETRCHDGKVYWLERRPQQGGRTTIMCHHGGETVELLPEAYDCRTRAHEYGGGCYTVCAAGIFFIHDGDQQIHVLRDDAVAALTSSSRLRFADLVADAEHHRLFAVCEDHTSPGLPENSLVVIDTQDGSVHTLHRGHDFYLTPRYREGRLAWICWDFPDMPWDATRLFVADVDVSNRLSDVEQVAGGENISVSQPEWHGAALLYMSDISGWWNLHRYHDGAHSELYPVDAECSEPNWVFGLSSYCIAGENVFIAENRYGVHRLTRVNLLEGETQIIASDHNHLGYLSGDEHQCAMIACSATRPPEIVRADASGMRVLVAASLDIAERWLSIAEPLQLETRDGETVNAFYYPPTAPDSDAPTTPAMIVLGHGGPTGQSTAALDMRKQFWTSRGFAILDVNYRGSTGYGRDYRDSLYGRWGERDVQDLCDAALAVCRLGRADRDRLIIKGSSAGGFSVLAALTFEDVFCTGASYYGISDLETLVTDTHKFEARYLDKLVGPYPECKQLYEDRSPIHHVEQLACPVIFFQGEEDRVVPKQQAETMIDALLAKGLRVGYRLYPGEQHGFRRAGTIVDALETELCFYRSLFSDEEQDCDAARVSATGAD